MSFVLEIMEENDVAAILRYLTENGEWEGAAHGIALQVIHKGMDSLQGNQGYVFDRYIRQKYLNLECPRCHVRLPASEILVALVEDGLCSWCRKMVSNDD